MNNIDRLSVLPDDIIHKILSSFKTKRVIQLSVLSSRWRFRWTSMPYLHISNNDFGTSLKFSEFVNRLLSGRNDNIHVYSLKLRFCEMYSKTLLKKILDYAFSHNVERLDACLLTYEVNFPVDHFRSESLKHLSLTGECYNSMNSYTILLSSTYDLPALTTLRLDHVSFSGVELFSKCPNLKSLYLSCYKVMESDHSFTLCHPRLITLTIYDHCLALSVLNVVAPQLEKLVISRGFCKHVITAPNLSSLIWFPDSGLLEFSTNLPFLKTVDLQLYYTDSDWSGSRIAALLQQLRSVKFLQITLEFLKPLISYMEQIPLQPSPFSNLKRLKIYPAKVPSDDEAHKRIHLTSKVIKYFLDGSPNAIFTLVSYEETKEIQQKARLELFIKEKANIETNRSSMTPMESHKENDTNEEECLYCQYG